MDIYGICSTPYLLLAILIVLIARSYGRGVEFPGNRALLLWENLYVFNYTHQLYHIDQFHYKLGKKAGGTSMVMLGCGLVTMTTMVGASKKMKKKFHRLQLSQSHFISS